MAATPAKRLLEALKRSTANHELPLGPYEEDALRSLKAECNELYGKIEALMRGDGESESQLADLPDGDKAALVVHHQMIVRNKQCALLYFRERLATLTHLRLEAGLVLPDELRSNCGQGELTFFKDYDALYSGYARDVGLDLRAASRPPSDLYVEVRCNADCGEIVTEHSGVVRLDKGTSHYLRYADVEQLISQGMLQHVVSAA